MDMLNQTLPIVIYFLLIVLLIVAVVIGIKVLLAMIKIEKTVDDINNKIKSLNGLFSLVDVITDKISSLSDLLVNIISNKITNLFVRKKRKEEEEEDYE